MDKLRDDFLSGYLHAGRPDQAFLKGMDLDRLNPEFAETMHLLATDVPEYGIWEEKFDNPRGGEELLVTPASPRAIEEVEALFFRQNPDKTLEPYSERKIRNNLVSYIIAVRARLAQMSDNHIWLENLDLRDRKETARLQYERNLVRQGVKKLYYPDITRRILQSSGHGEFQSAPNNHAKRVQRIMTAPTDRRVILDEKRAFEGSEISSLIVNPLMLTNRQLENLGFTIPNNGKRQLSGPDRLHYISDLTGRIKSELSVLAPIGQADPHDRFGRYRLYASDDGKVIGTTNPVKGKPTIYKTSLVDALRRGEHIHTGYPKENLQIAKAISQILLVDKDLQKGNWEKVKDSAELEQAKTVLRELVESLENVRDQDKVEARELLEKAMTLESTHTRKVKKNGQEKVEVTVRLNPGAKRAQLEKAVRKLKQRRSTVIPHISRYNANDSRLLEVEMAEHQAIPFSELEDYLNSRKNPDDIWDKHVLSADQKEQIARRLQKWHDRFNPAAGREAYLEPYRSFCREIQSALQDTHNVVVEPHSSIGDLKQSLAVVHQMLALKRVWDSWENIYSQHLGLDRLPFFIHMKDQIRRLNLAPVRPESSLNFIFEKYREVAQQILDTCEQGIKVISQPGGKEQADKIRLELKRLMRSVDVAALLRQSQQYRQYHEDLDYIFGPASADEDDLDPGTASLTLKDFLLDSDQEEDDHED
jgi:hypothetical protein